MRNTNTSKSLNFKSFTLQYTESLHFYIHLLNIYTLMGKAKFLPNIKEQLYTINQHF